MTEIVENIELAKSNIKGWNLDIKLLNFNKDTPQEEIEKILVETYNTKELYRYDMTLNVLKLLTGRNKGTLREIYLIGKKKKEMEGEEDEEIAVNIYHNIENELREVIDIVSFKGEILIKINNAYTNDISILLGYLNILIKKYQHGYRNLRNDVLQSLEESNIVNSDFFNYDSWLLNFQNGYYDFIKDEFIKAKDCTKEFIFAINRKYRKIESDCPLFKKALNDYLKGNTIIGPDDIFEFMAYSLMFGNFLKGFFLNIGDTNTGKTQIMEILKAFVPSNNRLQVSIQRLTADKFGSWGLNNKILCYYDDMSDKIIYDVSMIKSITGGASEISIEAKHGEKQDMKNTAKIWQNGNYIPKISNSNDVAYLDRVIVIEFFNIIDRYSKNHTEQFHLTITKNKSEMNGIITELIKAGKRLYKRSNFRKKIKDYSKDLYVYKSNEIFAFMKDFCKKNSKGKISFNITKEIINEYRMDRKKPLYTSYELKKQFEHEGYFKAETHIKNDKTYIIKGLQWKTTKEVQSIIDEYNQ